MEANWERSLAAVLSSEGGNVDDPDDHGGRTSRGITQREYNAWCKENDKPQGDVWQAQQSDIEAIYHEEYWEPWCDLLPTGVDYMSFDMNVNAGPYRSTVLLQRALGVNADGRIGPITRGAIRNCDAAGIVRKFTIVKEKYYRSLHQPKFLKGWLNRNREVQAKALAMIGGKSNA